VGIAAAVSGALATFLFQNHQNGKKEKQQDETSFKEKFHELESRVVRLEVEMELFDRTGERRTRKRGDRHV
jgi:hypothetical protein